MTIRAKASRSVAWIYDFVRKFIWPTVVSKKKWLEIRVWLCSYSHTLQTLCISDIFRGVKTLPVGDVTPPIYFLFLNVLNVFNVNVRFEHVYTLIQYFYTPPSISNSYQ